MKPILHIVLLIIPILLKADAIFPPPQNLQLKHWYALGNYFQLSWDTPDTNQTDAQLMGYLLYRNLIFCDTLSSTSNIYLDFEPPFINDTICYYLTAYYINPIGESEPTDTVYHVGIAIGIEDKDLRTPLNLKFIKNYPNPFNPITTIEYHIPQSGIVQISVLDVLGKKIEILVNEKQNFGDYKVTFNGNKYPSGLYYYQIRYANYYVTKKMVLIR